MSKVILLSTAYLPPIAWFQHLLHADKVYLEQCENYSKQSYRNRCRILTANGSMDLSIPIQHKGKQAINEVLIQEAEMWRKQHWQAICSAYGKSAFFLYYKDAFEPFFQAGSSINLFEHNLKLIQLVLRFLKVNIPIELTERFESVPPNMVDLRNYFQAKTNVHSQELIIYKPYLQVFSEKYSFQPNLSILDILFNQGPVSKDFLIKTEN